MITKLLSIQSQITFFFLRVYYNFRYPQCKFGRSIKLYGKLSLRIRRSSEVFIGDDVIFRSNTKSNFVGIYKSVSIFVGDGACLTIGNNTGLSGTSIFVSNKIIIGQYCNFGGNTCIWDTDFHPIEYNARRIHDTTKIKSSPIIIGDDVFIGANSIILKGVTIGDRVIVGAGSVVTKNIPADETWAGNPARFIRKNY